jgi:hypothetical protein
MKTGAADAIAQVFKNFRIRSWIRKSYVFAFDPHFFLNN